MSNKYIKNYILSMINTVAGLIFPIITFPYVSRILGPDNLGIINFAQSYGYYFVHFANFGISSYAIREVSKVRDNKQEVTRISNEIYNINILFSLISGIVYFLGVFAVSKFRINWIVFSLYSAVIFTNFLTLEWLLQSFDDYFFTTVRSLIIRILSLLAVFALIKEENDYILYMGISCIAEMGTRLSNLTYSNKKYVKFKIGYKFLNFKKHFKPMFTMFTFRLINGISTNLDKIMIGFFLLYSDVGTYSAGIKFILMLSPVVETAGIVLFPKINISANRSNTEYIRNIKLNYNIILLLGIPMAVGMFLISPRLIMLFAGPAYEDSILVSRIMAAAIILGPIGDMLGSKTLLVHNKDIQLLISSSIVAVSNIIFNFILIPFFGIYGAAAASIISYIIAIIARLYFTNKIIQFRIFTKDILKYMIYIVPFVLIYMAFRNYIDTSSIYMFGFIIICFIIYILELYIFKDKTFALLLEKVKLK